MVIRRQPLPVPKSKIETGVDFFSINFIISIIDSESGLGSSVLQLVKKALE